jgi:hypothetical protein
MANSINWGKIYETTYWGVGVTSNSISWGRFAERVEDDGGTVESLSCVNNAIPDYNWEFYYRVIDDGGTVESLDCVPNL